MDRRSHSPDTLLAALDLAGPLQRVGYLLSSLILGFSAALLVPLGVSLGYSESEPSEAFAYTIMIGVVVGTIGVVVLHTDMAGLSRREGFAVVGLGWGVLCGLGCLPFAFAGTLSPIDAWFECVSGLSGTGASVIADVEVLPHGILFWRSFTHWLGGMGFVVLYIALFPLLGVGAMQLYQAEAPGPDKDRMTPKIRDTAKILWLIYLGLSAGLLILLLAGGMDWFDAVCQTFAAIGTGGFSTKNASIGGFHSAYVEWVIIAFMWLAATNFALHWAVLTGKPGKLLCNPEWRFFSSILVVFSAIVTLLIWATTDASFGTALRNAVFTMTSIGSTTGFATGDYERWAPLAQFLVFFLLFMGGSAGSTAGAMKAVRVQLLLKHAWARLFYVVHPRAVAPPRLGDRVVSSQVMQGVLGFIGLYLTTWVVATAGMSLVGLDFATAASAVATCMGGVGPGLGDVGPFDNYAWIHPAGKGLLTFCMLAGRLELFAVLLFITPSYWRR